MSRAIKFRAWRESQKFMLTPHSLVDLFDYGSMENPEGVVWMQFTGLTDKNGVEIYEGDILCAGNEKYKGVVFYKSSSTQFLVDVFLSGKRVCRNEVSEFIAKRGRAIKSECVVIGNIHQNPELTYEPSK